MRIVAYFCSTLFNVEMVFIHIYTYILLYIQISRFSRLSILKENNNCEILIITCNVCPQQLKRVKDNHKIEVNPLVSKDLKALIVPQVIEKNTARDRKHTRKMDPFIQVYNDTEEQLNQLLQILDKKKKGRSSTSSKEISEIISEAQETIQDLNESIEFMKQEQVMPEQEIRSREKNMATLDSKVRQCQTLNIETSQDSNVGTTSGSTNKQWPSLPQNNRESFSLDIEATAGSEDSQATEHDAVQEQLLREQDDQLDIIHQTMQNIHLQASTMGQELGEQGMILEELDTNVDGVMNKLSRGRRQLEWVYENNKERVNDCCIFLLIIALIVLLVLAFIL